MLTLSVLYLFLLAACDEPRSQPSVYVQSSSSVHIEQLERTTFAYSTESSDANAIIAELWYEGGAREVRAFLTDHGRALCTDFYSPRRPVSIMLYPALVLSPWPTNPIVLHENADGSVFTSTGCEESPGRIVSAQNGDPARIVIAGAR